MTVSVQASPAGGGDTDPVPWKNAADQIVSMLNQVRLEGNEGTVYFDDYVWWLCSMIMFHGYVPWLCSMILFHDYVPW